MRLYAFSLHALSSTHAVASAVRSAHDRGDSAVLGLEMHRLERFTQNASAGKHREGTKMLTIQVLQGNPLF